MVLDDAVTPAAAPGQPVPPLLLAYDRLARSDDGTLRIHPNAADPPVGRSFVALLAAYALMTPDSFSIATVEACLAAGSPFIYPIELEYRFVETYPSGDVPLAAGIPAAVLSAVRRDQATILFFFAHEARRLVLPPDEAREQRSVFDLLHAFLRQNDLPPARVWFLDGDLSGDAGFTAWRTARGLSAAESARYRPVDFCAALARQTHALQRRECEIVGGIAPESWETTLSLVPAARSHAERYTTPARLREELVSGHVRSRTYVCLNNQPRLQRQLIVSWLHAAGLIGNGHVSFPAMPADLNGAGSWPDTVRRDREAWLALQPHLPLCVDIGDPFTAIWRERRAQFFVQPTLFPYDDSYVNLTNETFFFADDLLFLSEKSYKPILYLQPFVLFGNPGSLARLRADGFRTFPGLIDESYDTLTAPMERLHAAYAQAERLARLTPAAARDLVMAVLPDLAHNFERLTEGNFVFDAVMAELASQLAGDPGAAEP